MEPTPVCAHCGVPVFFKRSDDAPNGWYHNDGEFPSGRDRVYRYCGAIDSPNRELFRGKFLVATPDEPQVTI